MVEAIYRDGPKVTKVALFGVIGLVLIMFGLRGALPILLSLLLGITWLGGMLGHLSLKWMLYELCDTADYAWDWRRVRGEHVGAAAAGGSRCHRPGYCRHGLSGRAVLGHDHHWLLDAAFGLESCAQVVWSGSGFGEVTCLLSALVFLPVLAHVFLRKKK